MEGQQQHCLFCRRQSKPSDTHLLSIPIPSDEQRALLQQQRQPNQPHVGHTAMLTLWEWPAAQGASNQGLGVLGVCWQLQVNGTWEMEPATEQGSRAFPLAGNHSRNRDGRLVLFYCHCWQRGTPGQAAQHRKFCRPKDNLYWLIFFLYLFYFRAVMLTKLLVLFTSTREVRFYVLSMIDKLLKTVHIFANWINI